MANPPYTKKPIQVDLALLDNFIAETGNVYIDQLLCVGRYWAKQYCSQKEGVTEKGSCVDKFIASFYSQEQRGKYEAWCVSFVVYLINETSNLLNCPNTFPQFDDKTWAGAKSTLVKAGQKGFKVYSNPYPGRAFYRYSEDVKATGHFGLVLWTGKFQNDDYMLTVEGNVKISDGKDGVGAFLYKLNEINPTTDGWAFIDIASKQVCNAQSIVAYKGQDCKKKVIIPPKEDEPIVKNSGYSGTTQQSGYSGTNNYQSGYSSSSGYTQQSGYTGYSGYNSGYQSGQQTQKTPCEIATVRIPSANRIQHYSALQNPSVAGDITGANFGVKGSIFKYTGASEYTDYGIVKDNNGNMIFIIDASKGKSNFLFQEGYVAPIHPTGVQGLEKMPNAYIIPINLEYNSNGGPGSAERKADMLAGKIPFHRDEASNPGRAILWRLQGTVINKTTLNQSKLGDWYNVWNQGSVPNLFKWIESKGKLDRPIVIYLFANAPGKMAYERFAEGLSYMTQFVSMVPGLPQAFPQELVGKIGQASNAVAKGQIDVGLFVQVANGLVPESVKGFVQDKVNSVGPFLKDAENAFNSIKNGIITQAQSIIGLDFAEIQKVWNKYEAGVNANLPNFVKKLGDYAIQGVVKRVNNLEMVRAVEQASSMIESGRVKQWLIEKTITEVPIFQDLLLAGSSDTVMPAIPQYDKFVYNITSNEFSYNKNLGNPAYGDNSTNLHGNLINALFGMIPEKETFDIWVKQSLMNKALQYAVQGIPYVLPAHLSENRDLAECYKVEIEKNTGAKVIVCPPGYDYDPYTQTCKSTAVTSSGYGGGTMTGSGSTTQQSGYSGTTQSGYNGGGGSTGGNIGGGSQIGGGNVIKMLDCITRDASGKFWYRANAQQVLELVNQNSNIATKPNLPSMDELQKQLNSSINEAPKNNNTALPNSADVFKVTNPNGQLPTLPNTGLPNNPSGNLPVLPPQVILPPVYSPAPPQMPGGPLPTNPTLPIPPKVPFTGGLTLSDDSMLEAYYGVDNGKWYVKKDGQYYEIDPVTCLIKGDIKFSGINQFSGINITPPPPQSSGFSGVTTYSGYDIKLPSNSGYSYLSGYSGFTPNEEIKWTAELEKNKEINLSGVTPETKVFPCITYSNGQYTFAYQGKTYKAYYQLDRKDFIINYDGQWIELNNCVPNLPTPKVEIPQLPPIQPELPKYSGYIPPYVPESPKPYVPEVPQYSGYVPQMPEMDFELPQVSFEPIPQNSYNAVCNDCERKKLPAMIEQKIIYEYPPHSEDCYDEDC